MKPIKTPLEIASGKLISAIQKEWMAELGELTADASEDVMHHSHELLKGAKAGTIAGALDGRTVADFLGKAWVEAHPSVQPYVETLQRLA